MNDQRQLNLFGEPEAQPAPRRGGVGPADCDDHLQQVAQRLPKNVYFGTSSWSFPGWAGLVYDRNASRATLARKGLAAYAQHPLLRAVGIDRTYYAPLPAETFAEYAAQVPEDFRFLVKASGQSTTPFQRDESGRPAGRNELFLHPPFVMDEVIGPYLEGLGHKAGTLVFQFPPLGHKWTSDPPLFIEVLGQFLEQLPAGPTYTVELRDHQLFQPAYVDRLRQAEADHCLSLHPRMPTAARQLEAWQPRAGKPLVVRWMLHAGLQYEDAKNRYDPFNELVDEDPSSRSTLARLCREHAASAGEVILVANNKAEGSAPWTVFKLAEEITRV